MDSVDEMERVGVYPQKCLDCPKMYVGETGRKAKEWMKEHEVYEAMRMRSTISEHTHILNQRPDFDSFRVVEVESNLRKQGEPAHPQERRSQSGQWSRRREVLQVYFNVDSPYF